MKIYTLFSGSTGNALLAECGGTHILIDAGKSLRSLRGAAAAAEADLASVEAVFITHEHSDHISALPMLAKHIPIPIHACGATAEHLAAVPGVGAHLIRHPAVFTERIGAITVTAFPLSHDSACHVGYRLEGDDGDCFVTATDTGTVPAALREALRGCCGALLEANYDEDMLRFGPYPYPLKERIRSAHGHLSNTDCAALCEYAVSVGVCRLALGHLSKENNSPEAALHAVTSRIGDRADVTVCARDAVTRIL